MYILRDIDGNIRALFGCKQFAGQEFLLGAQLQVLSAAELQERQQAEFEAQRMVKALAVWTSQKLSIPPAQARDEILTIYRSL